MSRASIVLAGTALLATLAWFAYLPGLHGGFLFDDFVNLDAIGATGPVDDLRTLARYLTSGIADPTGRPLALLSFLLDARDWPADPAPFLRTNVLLHIGNALLLIGLLRSLGRVLMPDEPSRTESAALLGAGLWLLHPLFVSTTLYIVQRESMLAATFCLAGLWAYVAARQRYRQRPGAGALWSMALAIVAGTGLSMLCKANGVLLPTFALVLEATVLGRLGVADAPLRKLRLALLATPTLLVLAYLASYATHPSEVLADRGWSVAQRLLTEPRALFSYLALLLVPRVYSSGLYNDAFAASTGWLQPWTTLPCLAGLLMLSVMAWKLRDRQPAVAAAIGFFLAGHLLESSTIPLELYFEHRNYLPAALLFWPLAVAFSQWRARVSVRAAVSAIALLALALVAWERATVWSNQDLLTRVWALQHPGSSRAQATAAMFDISAGRPVAAMARLRPIWRERPGDLQIAFNYIDAACSAGRLDQANADALGASIAQATAGVRLMHGWLAHAIDAAAEDSCPGLDLGVAERWVGAMAMNPAFASAGDHDQEVEPLLGKIALARGDGDTALVHFDRALASFVTPDTAARQAALMASSGAYRQALAHLDHYARLEPATPGPARGMPYLHARVLAWQDYWPNEIAILRAKLEGEIAAQERNTK
jgi:tetratricopeptide (TPR) repeat protein